MLAEQPSSVTCRENNFRRMAMAKIIEHILQRRSIRKFTAQKVELEIIDCLLQAAMAAPSASNARPWEFIIISDESRLKEMEACLPFGRMGAPLMIIVLGNPSIAANRSSEKFWMQDCCAATENILLAAAGLGLGGCWLGVYPIFTLVKRVSTVVNLPEGVTPLCAINLGYPAEEKQPRTQYDPARVHWQAY
jgi:nitroreductase